MSYGNSWSTKASGRIVQRLLKASKYCCHPLTSHTAWVETCNMAQTQQNPSQAGCHQLAEAQRLERNQSFSCRTDLASDVRSELHTIVALSIDSETTSS